MGLLIVAPNAFVEGVEQGDAEVVLLLRDIFRLADCLECCECHSHLEKAILVLVPQGILRHECVDLVQEIGDVTSGWLVGAVLAHAGIVAGSGAEIKSTA